jgi:drug/metabolite transporter (DMT)-like permease
MATTEALPLVRGRLLAIGAGACFGTLGLLTKLFYESGGRPFDLLLIRLVGTAIVVWAILGLLRQPLPPRAAIGTAVALTVFQIVHNAALLAAYDRAPVGLIVLLLYTFPLVVTVGDTLFFREPFGHRQWLALLVGLIGVGLTVGGPSSAPVIGVVLGLVASFSLAAYVLTARRAIGQRDIRALQIIALGYSAPALVVASAGTVHRFDSPSAAGWLCALGIVLVATILASFLFYTAVPTIGVSSAAVLTLIDPAMSLLLAFVFLGEGLSPRELAGGALILGCVLTIALPRRRDRGGARAGAAAG